MSKDLMLSNPLKLEKQSTQTKNWDDFTRLSYDPCARTTHDTQSKSVGTYVREVPGYRWCETNTQYINNMSDAGHYQKVYNNSCYIDTDSKLRGSLTDPKLKHQLLTRPYRGSYMGAGQRSLDDMNTESELIYGLDTRSASRKACDVLSGVTINRFEYLPTHGNPQRVEHIIPQWVRGGDNTRDYVRRVNYEKRCKNKNQDSIKK